MSEYRFTSTLHNVILTGIRFAWGQKKTLDIYRDMGGSIRDTDFHRAYRETWEQIEAWAQEQNRKNSGGASNSAPPNV